MGSMLRVAPMQGAALVYVAGSVTLALAAALAGMGLARVSLG